VTAPREVPTGAPTPCPEDQAFPAPPNATRTFHGAEGPVFCTDNSAPPVFGRAERQHAQRLLKIPGVTPLFPLPAGWGTA
jgi:hypothetical protein